MIKITIPDLEGEVTDIYDAVVAALELLKIGDSVVEIDPSDINVRINGRSGKPTKGELIWRGIQEVVESGEYKTRQQIANEANGATVSRVQEVLKAHAGSPTIRQYRRMAELAKIRQWEEDHVEPLVDPVPEVEELEMSNE